MRSSLPSSLLAACTPEIGFCPCQSLHLAHDFGRHEAAAIDDLRRGQVGEWDGLPLFAALVIRRRFSFYGLELPTLQRIYAGTYAVLPCPSTGAGLVLHRLANCIRRRGELPGNYGPVSSRCPRAGTPQTYALALEDPGLRMRRAAMGKEDFYA
ncbi:hypothetical protein [Fodinicurvata sediminis]|uniref:hypothetical protein n=1 Tax=Fodinicurvata sediminis TaxID=1121832 RepID=UPI0003B5F2B0|nr:hypothetical protein [Fodinicurvata sediminis]